MKNISASILAIAFAMGAITSTQAADEKKNPPKRRDVEQALQTIGGDHYPEHMKITEVGSIETATTWYHIYSGYRRDENVYRIIVFDNTPKYLGYYEVSLEPSDVGDGAIVLYDESSGQDKEYKLITDKGLAPGFSLSNGESPKLVKAPAPEQDESTADAASATSGDETALPGEEQDESAATPEQEQTAAQPAVKTPEYRTWTVSRGGQKITFSAIFVELKDRKTIVLKNSKNGNTADILITELSPADRQYLKDFLE